MADVKTIPVEVAYALADEQAIIPVEVPQGTTLEQAIQLSRITERFPGIDLATQDTGIFGKPAKGSTVLHPGDRVEIYRPLIADPKQVRKQRAAQGRRVKKGSDSPDS
ncbi:MAG: RnfH family protein [Candidatus Competibacteraceae bacterium]|nr:RnfH family protein [Candidatus Competibacteraceae bacterium]